MKTTTINCDFCKATAIASHGGIPGDWREVNVFITGATNFNLHVCPTHLVPEIKESVLTRLKASFIRVTHAEKV